MQKNAMIALYPGSFDPVTHGHMDVITRAASFSEKLVVAVLHNSAKVPFFSLEERLSQLRQLTASYPNVEVDSFSGLLVDYAKVLKATLIIRGLRTVSDFETEAQMAWINRSMAPEIETVFIPATARNVYISSSAARELAQYNGDLSRMVPPLVEKAIQDWLQEHA